MRGKLFQQWIILCPANKVYLDMNYSGIHYYIFLKNTFKLTPGCDQLEQCSLYVYAACAWFEEAVRKWMDGFQKDFEA